MLFVNNEYLNLGLSLEETPAKHRRFKEEFEAFQKEIKGFKFPVVFKVKRSDVRKVNPYKNHYEPTPADRITLKVTHQSPLGNEEWVYQKNFPKLKPNGQPIWKEAYEWVRGSMLVHEGQLDKLFFIMKKSPYLKTRVLYHFDPALIARKKVESIELKNKVESLIFNETSPVSGNYEFLRTIAKSFGIPKIDGLDNSEVKLALLNKVLSGDDIKSKGAQAFIDACNMDEGVKIKAKIQDAVDKGLIRFTPQKKEVTYAGGNVVCTISGRPEFWLDEFVKYLKDDQKALDKIMGAVSTNKLHDFKPEDVDNLVEDWTKLKEVCSDLGIRVAGRKKEDIADDLRAYATK